MILFFLLTAHMMFFILFLLVIYFANFFRKEFEKTKKQLVIPTKFEILIDKPLVAPLNYKFINPNMDSDKNDEEIKINLLFAKYSKNKIIIMDEIKPDEINLHWSENVFTSFVEHISLKFKTLNNTIKIN